MNSSKFVNATMYDFRAPNPNAFSNYAKSTIPIEYTYSNAYPCPKAFPEGIVLGGSKSSKCNRQQLIKSPSDTPLLSSSLSSLSSASPEEDDDAHITQASQTPIRYANSLIQKISLVDKLVGKCLRLCTLCDWVGGKLEKNRNIQDNQKTFVIV
jgi:hypothetical protein